MQSSLFRERRHVICKLPQLLCLRAQSEQYTRRDSADMRGMGHLWERSFDGVVLDELRYHRFVHALTVGLGSIQLAKSIAMSHFGACHTQSQP